MAFLGMNRSQAKSLGRLNNAIGSKIMSIWFPGLGAVVGAAVDTAIGSVSDNRPESQYSLMMGPGDPYAGFRQTDMGPDYTVTESIKDVEGYKGMDTAANALGGSNIMNMFGKKKQIQPDSEDTNVNPNDTNPDGTKNNVQGLSIGGMQAKNYQLGNWRESDMFTFKKPKKF